MEKSTSMVLSSRGGHWRKELSFLAQHPDNEFHNRPRILIAMEKVDVVVCGRTFATRHGLLSVERLAQKAIISQMAEDKTLITEKANIFQRPTTTAQLLLFVVGGLIDKAKQNTRGYIGIWNWPGKYSLRVQGRVETTGPGQTSGKRQARALRQTRVMLCRSHRVRLCLLLLLLRGPWTHASWCECPRPAR